MLLAFTEWPVVALPCDVPDAISGDVGDDPLGYQKFGT